MGRSSAASPAAVLTRQLSPGASIDRMRGVLLGGYGAGASADVVTAVTRDRQMIGHMATWSRRARTAERTRNAHDGWADALPGMGRRIPRALVAVGGPVLVLGMVRILRAQTNATAKVRGRRS